MAYDVVITTEPMAREMLHVADKVSTVSSAVSSMSRAICDAELQSANRVCEKVDQGFLGVIMSQISQKKVLALTTATSQLERMRQLAQILVRIKEQMGRDYERITSRYTKLFRKLGDALRSRIYEIDRPAADVSDTQYVAMEHRVLINAAAIPVLEQDVEVATAALSVARCKADCCRVIDGVRTLVEHGNVLRAAMTSIVADKSVSKRETVYMPVVIMSSKDVFLQDGVNTDYFIGQEEAQAQVAQEIHGKLFETDTFFNWRDAPESLRQKVFEFVNRRMAEENIDARTAQIMSKMLAGSRWQVPESMS